MCKCDHIIDGNSFQFCISSNESLYEKLDNLQKENAELKKQLNKKTAPQKWTLVRDTTDGDLGYSKGELDENGYLIVLNNRHEYSDEKEFKYWQEIEIKVKE